ncbi:SpvB/TcaC N-terminal domain-containing protein [Cerasicoccus frondis]|uniref:SpvB/TcaC N-terminal domain-containing protein n=1 Tax=Cerasicoccus frondis TaxID=490090 RepID=UPI002852ACA7|nr:RHS repeat-associated core domain-containing protein [Cerasicoccus frondis]
MNKNHLSRHMNSLLRRVLPGLFAAFVLLGTGMPRLLADPGANPPSEIIDTDRTGGIITKYEWYLEQIDAYGFGSDAPDSDNDNLLDGWELLYGFSIDDDGSVNCVNGAEGDPDFDGLANYFEQIIESDPTVRDTDADGLFDGWEYALGLDPVNDPLTLVDLLDEGLSAPDGVQKFIQSFIPNSADTPVSGGSPVFIREYWTASFASLSELYDFDSTTERYPDLPTGTESLSEMETPAGWTLPSDSSTLPTHGGRLSVTITPSTTDFYELVVTGGSETEVWFSEDGDPSNAERILDKDEVERTVTVYMETDSAEFEASYYIEVVYTASVSDDPVSLTWVKAGNDSDSPVAIPGTVSWDYWSPFTDDLDALKIWSVTGIRFPGNADGEDTLDAVSTPAGWSADDGAITSLGDHGARMRGRIVAPVSGSYTFTLEGGTETNLWLSRDGNVFNRRELLVDGSGERSVVVDLVEGQSYYLEVHYIADSADSPVSLQWLVSNPEPALTGGDPLLSGEVIGQDDFGSSDSAPSLSWSSSSDELFNVSSGDGSVWSTGEMTLSLDCVFDDELYSFMTWFSPEELYSDASSAYGVFYNVDTRTLSFLSEGRVLAVSSQLDLQLGTNRIAVTVRTDAEDAIEVTFYINGERVYNYPHISVEFLCLDYQVNSEQMHDPLNGLAAFPIPGSMLVVTTMPDGDIDEFIDNVAWYDVALGEDILLPMLEEQARSYAQDDFSAGYPLRWKDTENYESVMAWANAEPVIEWIAPEDGADLAIRDYHTFSVSAADFENRYLRVEYFQMLGIEPAPDTDTRLHVVYPLNDVDPDSMIPLEPLTSDPKEFSTAYFHWEETASTGLSYYARVTDNNGAQALTEPVSVNWVNTPPIVEWVSPLESTINWTAGKLVTLEAFIVDPDGAVDGSGSAPVSIELLDDADQAVSAIVSNDGFNYTFIFTQDVVSEHSYRIVATDDSSDTTESAAVSFDFEGPIPGVQWIDPWEISRMTLGDTKTLKVLADSNVGISYVEFYEGSISAENLLGVDSSGGGVSGHVYSLEYTPLATATKTLIAQAVIDDGSLLSYVDASIILQIIDEPAIPVPGDDIDTLPSVGLPVVELPTVTPVYPADGSTPSANDLIAESDFESFFGLSGQSYSSGWTTFWLGEVNVWNFPWVYHRQHGWLYVESVDSDYWFYDAEIGWWSASDATYDVAVSNQTWLFSQLAGWLWYDSPTTNPRWFYSDEEEDWVDDVIQQDPIFDFPTSMDSTIGDNIDYDNGLGDYLADYDGDGLANIHEILLGTEADNASSTLTVGDATANPDVILSTLPVETTTSASGTLNINVPIGIVPGTSGTQPSLALNYNSTSSNGVMGVGWNLSGFSAITRGPSSRLIDGFVDGVNYTDTDRFYIDGKRLILISQDKEYGEDGAEYRTEFNDFSRIWSYGSLGNGPESLVVETKSGLTMTYGAVANSRYVIAGESAALTWHLTRVTDAVGNYYEYTYEQPTNDDPLHLTRIAYTGNENTGALPYAYVYFRYEERPDQSMGYMMGKLLKNRYRLQAIESYYEDDLFRRYSMRYTESQNTRRSQLLGIVTESSDGTRLLPTVFEWEAMGTGKRIIKMGDNTGHGAKVIDYQGDYDGDGKMDIAQISSSGGSFDLDILYSNGRSFNKQNVIKSGGSFNFSSSNIRFFQGDFDGDGDADFMKVAGTNNSQDTNYKFIENEGNGQWASSESPWTVIGDRAPYWNTERPAFEADFTGDGRTDILFVYPTGFPTSSAGDNGAYGVTFDLAVSEGNHIGQHIAMSDSSARWIALGGDQRGLGQFWHMGDFNGDGYMDIAQQYFASSGANQNYYRLAIYLNEPNGESGQRQFTYHPQDGNLGQVDFYNLHQRIRVADVNGDGCSDVVYFDGNSRKMKVSYSKGDYEGNDNMFSSPKVIYDYRISSGTGVTWHVADLYGDGVLDIIQLISSSVRTMRQGPKVDRVATATVFNFRHPLNGKNSDLQVIPINENEVQALRGYYNSGFYSVSNYFADEINDINDSILIPQTSNKTTLNALIGDFSGNGQAELLVAQLGAGGVASPYRAFVSKDSDATYDVIGTVTNGLGVQTRAYYQRLTNPNFYTKGEEAENLGSGYFDFQNAALAVVEIHKDTGMSDENGDAIFSKHQYRYANLVSNRERGSMGFGQMTTTDIYGDELTTVTTTEFNQEYPFTGLVSATTTALEDGTTLNRATMSSFVDIETVSGLSDIHFIIAETETKETYEPTDGLETPYSTVVTTKSAEDYDEWGNLAEITVDMGGGFTTTTVSEYGDDADHYRYGRLTRSTVTQTTGGGDAKTKTSSFVYDADATWLLTTETVEPDEPEFALSTTYTYDGYGNVIRTQVTGEGGEGLLTRTAYTQMDATGRFALRAINDVGHSSSSTFEAKSGSVLTTIGPNGLTTVNAYDSFDRLISVTSADGTVASTQRLRASDLSVDAPEDALTAVRVVSTAAPDAPGVTYFDRLGRELRTVSIAGNGAKVYVDKLYQIRQLPEWVSMPYFGGTSDPIYWGQTFYDSMGRVTLQVTPGEGATGFVYSGLTNSTYRLLDGSPDGLDPDDIAGSFALLDREDYELTSSLSNVAGQVIETTDNAGVTLQQEYDAHENLVKTILPNSAGAILMAYDQRGHKTSMTDLNMGAWHYVTNAFGELIEQYDNAGNAVVFAYDEIGRVISRADYSGVTVSAGDGVDGDYATGSLEETATWTYDAGVMALGKLVSVETRDDNAVVLYRSEVDYDLLGRAEETRERIGDEWFATSTTYDAYSRPLALTYPGETLTVYNVYDSKGYLQEVRRDDAVGELYWQADAYDHLGNFTQFTLGNDVVTRLGFEQDTGFLTSMQTGASATKADIQNFEFDYTKVGYLTRRTDLNRKLQETISYDALNRMEHVDLTHELGEAGEMTFQSTTTYDSLGNLTGKAGVIGTMQYGEATIGGVATNAGINALTSSDDYAWFYDSNGSLLKKTDVNDPTSVVQSYTWTTFNQVKSITRAGTGVTTFDYGADRQRVRQYLYRSVDNTDETIYVGGGLYEVITEWRDSVETVKKRHYISTPVGAVAVFVEEDSENDGVVDSETLEYLHYDHQGSLSAITASVIALDGNGDAQNVRHNSYDAWGRQRDVETWGYDFDAQTQTGSYAWLAQQEHDYSIGYTGHENLDEFEIVHMNGRLYDAQVGRFISADPFIQFPSNLQSFNRYSYVLNNPLSYTDPSGYFLDGIFDAIGDFFSSVGNWVSENWRTVVGIAVAVVVFYAAPYALTAAGATLGTAQTSFVGTVAGGIAAGGVNDGVRGAIMGGAFASAFWVVGGTLADGGVVPGYDSGAEVGELAVKMVAHGVIGGTQQVFAGGDFLQGMFASAVTAGASPGISGIDVGSRFGDFALQTTAASMVGGTASVIAGGKFANGAYSAAFGYLFNQLSSQDRRKAANERKARLKLNKKMNKIVAAEGKGMLIDYWKKALRGINKLPDDVKSNMFPKTEEYEQELIVADVDVHVGASFGYWGKSNVFRTYVDANYDANGVIKSSISFLIDEAGVVYAQVNAATVTATASYEATAGFDVTGRQVYSPDPIKGSFTGTSSIGNFTVYPDDEKE